MKKGRLEAFSDGVIAIVITIMVLELKAPKGSSLDALVPLLPTFGAYVLSFLYIGIYWNNHHHLLHTVRRVTGGVMWANLHLLFWLSVVPFATAWMGNNQFAPATMAVYGFALMMPGVAYYILQSAIVRTEGLDSPLARALGRDVKGKISVVAYLFAIPLAFVSTLLAAAIFVAVAVLWLVPDRRIEAVLAEES